MRVCFDSLSKLRNSSRFPDIIVTTSGEPVTSKEIKTCIQEIQELIVGRLNQAVANKLISSVDYLRESFVGTLERCLSSLEKSTIDSSVHNITSNHLKQVGGLPGQRNQNQRLWSVSEHCDPKECVLG